MQVESSLNGLNYLSEMHYQYVPTIGLIGNFGKLTHLTYLYYTSLLQGKMHYLEECETSLCSQCNTFLMANDCIDR